MGISYERRDYFAERFTVDELRDLLNGIGVTPRELLSTRSRAYQQRRDAIDSLDDEGLLQAMVEEPTLIRRPIVVGDRGHVIGSKKADLERLAATHS